MGTLMILIALLAIAIGTGGIVFGSSDLPLKRTSAVLGSIYLSIGTYLIGWLTGDSILYLIMMWTVGPGPGN